MSMTLKVPPPRRFCCVKRPASCPAHGHQTELSGLHLELVDGDIVRVAILNADGLNQLLQARAPATRSGPANVAETAEKSNH